MLLCPIGSKVRTLRMFTNVNYGICWSRPKSPLRDQYAFKTKRTLDTLAFSAMIVTVSLIQTHGNYHYSKEVCRMTSEKYNLDAMEALRRCLFSESHRMFVDPELEMLDFPPIGIFDM